MRVIDLENINYAMRNETQFVLRVRRYFTTRSAPQPPPFCPTARKSLWLP